jgi:hypothetical protein
MNFYDDLILHNPVCKHSFDVYLNAIKIYKTLAYIKHKKSDVVVITVI